MSKKGIIAIIASIMSVVLIASIVLLVVFTNGKPEPTQNQTIKLSWNFGYKKDAWEAVVNSYNTKNTEGVKVVLDEQAGAGYDNWVRNELLDQKSTTSIVLANGVSEFFSQNKFVNLNGYASGKNAYNENKVWKSTLEDSAFVPTGNNKEVYYLNYETTATTWYFNQKIFNQYGLKAPTNWNELIALCKTLKDNAITPLSISGDRESLISWQLGWLLRLYSDQFLRNKEPLVLAQKGDYCYDEEAQKSFVFDMTSVNNDAEQGFVLNPLRFMKLVKDGELGPNTVEFKALLSELMRLIPEYVPTDFLAMDTADSQKRFINGETAMYIGLIEFGANWERTIADANVERFDLGTFNNPPMKNELCSVDYVRSMGGASGSLGVINRNKSHNNAAVDFLKYFSSIEGQTLYYAKLAEDDVAPSGPSLIKNVVMPDKWSEIFKNISFNGLADKNPMTYFSRGFWEVASTNTAYVENMQKLLGKTMTVEAYCEEMQSQCKIGINKKISIYDWKSDALNDVTKDPKAV